MEKQRNRLKVSKQDIITESIIMSCFETSVLKGKHFVNIKVPVISNRRRQFLHKRRLRWALSMAAFHGSCQGSTHTDLYNVHMSRTLAGAVSF